MDEADISVLVIIITMITIITNINTIVNTSITGCGHCLQWSDALLRNFSGMVFVTCDL
jgi:hypothetical protein